MVFSNLLFLYLFLPLNLGVYFLCKNPVYKNASLIVFSLVFYAWGEPVWVCLLIFSSLLDYAMGRVIGRFGRGKWGKVALCASVVINLGLLCAFKYSGFLYANINALLGTGFTVPAFALPIGISFYTFQTMSYTIDVYRGKVDIQKSFFNFLLYVSLYFQLVAGPIVRYTEIAERIERRSENWRGIALGFNRFFIGLVKKVLVANTAGKLAAPYLDGQISSLSVLGSWFGAVLFALQIYYDFSGYSDMAIGLGQMFGFHHPENFDYPYISRSATEFWRRWHMTLGRFFRDYLYIPLGGNRRHMVFNLMITWFATGLWHGASWNFVLWGLYYGLLILLERLFLSRLFERIPKIFSHLYLLIAMVFGWMLFYFTSLERALAYMGRMLGIGFTAFYDLPTLFDIANNCFWLAAALIFCTPVCRLFSHLPERVQLAAENLRPAFNFVLLGLCTALLVGQSYNPFLYFRF